MPTYDYDCASCHQTFEIFQSIVAPSLETCPTCGGKVQRRIHGGTGLIFKGTGFYLTDYKKSGTGSENKSENKTEKSEDKAKPANEKGGAEKSASDTTKSTTTPSS
ncbi:MAG: FmdB family zinc ribbon protein [candidate division KSB1 bacterium]